MVTEYRILEEVMETEKEQENPGDYAEDGQGMETEGRITTEMEENRMEQNRPLIGKKMTIFLWLAAFGAAAGYWYIRYGRKSMDDEGRMVFEIPMNFAVEGTMLGGRIRAETYWRQYLY